jgi:hypothetical protein
MEANSSQSTATLVTFISNRGLSNTLSIKARKMASGDGAHYPTAQPWTQQRAENPAFAGLAPM